MSLGTAIAAIAALLVPLGAYLVAARQFSGKVGSSEASQLWEESRSLRKEAGARIEVLEQRNLELQRDIAKLRAALDEARQQLVELRVALSESHAANQPEREKP